MPNVVLVFVVILILESKAFFNLRVSIVLRHHFRSVFLPLWQLRVRKTLKKTLLSVFFARADGEVNKKGDHGILHDAY